MSSRYPLTLNTASTTIEELPSSIDLDLSGSNISNVGNIVAGNSVAANYFIGSGANLTALAGANVTGAVPFATTANAVAGANVSGTVNLATYATTANAVAGANVSGAVSFATTANVVAGANVSGAVSFATTANAVAVGNVSGIGNIATVNLNGNASTVLYGNGVFGATPSGTSISNGTSNINASTSGGNILVGVGGVANTVIFGSANLTVNTPIRTANSVIVGPASAGNTAVASTRGDIAMGYQAGGGTISGDPCVAIGFASGNIGQTQGSVAIGFKSGRSQGDACIAIGYETGTTQGIYNVAIGLQAGQNQTSSAVAIGVSAGATNQGASTVAIGAGAGASSQGANAISIGTRAGYSGQGANTIAIGANAGYTSQAVNSIILNATGANLDQTTANTFTVKPVRAASGTQVLYYDSSTGEITYNAVIIPQNSQSADYTMVLGDSGKQIFHPSADTTGRTFTVPANGTVPYVIGTTLTVINQSAAGSITIAITTDTMRLAGNGATGSRTLAANGISTIYKITSTEWIISGVNLT